ncbi:MAG: uracil-DNA glycosylase [Thiobacillaceae bacterium]
MATLTNCRDCPRLAHFLDAVAAENPGYFCKPVPPFGDPNAKFMIVGLAPGMHGANRTGRPFTGDHAGILLYHTLHEFGIASEAVSQSVDDGLKLSDCRITNAVKCLPPDNKPLPAEIKQCNRYLRMELGGLPEHSSVLALGKIAHDAVVAALGLKAKDHPFGHGAMHFLPTAADQAGTAHKALRIYDSYHCSRYNTQTRRLTPEMFRAVFARITRELEE